MTKSGRYTMDTITRDELKALYDERDKLREELRKAWASLAELTYERQMGGDLRGHAESMFNELSRGAPLGLCDKNNTSSMTPCRCSWCRVMRKYKEDFPGGDR